MTPVSPRLFPLGTLAELPVYTGSAVILVTTFQDTYLCGIFLTMFFYNQKSDPLCLEALSSKIAQL